MDLKLGYFNPLAPGVQEKISHTLKCLILKPLEDTRHFRVKLVLLKLHIS